MCTVLVYAYIFSCFSYTCVARDQHRAEEEQKKKEELKKKKAEEKKKRRVLWEQQQQMEDEMGQHVLQSAGVLCC